MFPRRIYPCHRTCAHFAWSDSLKGFCTASLGLSRSEEGGGGRENFRGVTLIRSATSADEALFIPVRRVVISKRHVSSFSTYHFHTGSTARPVPDYNQCDGHEDLQ